MYSPVLGRFMQTDPIGYGDGLNAYRYAGNDPINAKDPTGLDPCDAGDPCYNLPPIGFPPSTPTTSSSSSSSSFIPGLSTIANFLNNLFGGSSTAGAPAAPPPKPDRPQYGHSYDTTEQIYRVPLSQAQRGLVNRSTAVLDGTIEGSRIAGTYPVGGWLSGIISTIGGYVTTCFSTDYNIAGNTTTSVHLFVGNITRTIYSNNDGAFVRVVGSGNAGGKIIGRTRDEINNTAGPGIFRDANALYRTVSKQLNPSC